MKNGPQFSNSVSGFILKIGLRLRILLPAKSLGSSLWRVDTLADETLPLLLNHSVLIGNSSTHRPLSRIPKL